MTRAAIYARYSSDNQRAESITAQVRARTEFCLARGYIIAKQYVDEARTGTNEDRPAFRSMIRDAKTGDTFQVVVVHKIDRFARDRYDDAFYKRELSKAGVRRESVVEYFGDGPQAELVENIMADFAAYFTDNLRWETKKGLGVNASEARSCSGKPPLGYDYDDQKRYVINEIEAPVVRLIFVMYDAGHTYSEILIALTPYRSKRGRPFTPNSLHDILRNEKYMGRFVYNKRDTSGKTRNNHAFRPEAEWIVVEDGCPAIVDRDLWERVQARMEGRKEGTPGKSSPEGQAGLSAVRADPLRYRGMRLGLRRQLVDQDHRRTIRGL